MAAYVTWNGKTLVGIDGSSIRMLGDMTLTMTTKTKAKDGEGILFVGRQGFNAAKLDLTLELDERLGVDVMEEIRAWTDISRAATCGRLLVGGKDVTQTDYMVTGVTASSFRIRPGGAAVAAANLKLTFTESDGAVYENTGSGDSAKLISTGKQTKGSGSPYVKKSTSDGGSTSGGSSYSSGAGNLTGAYGGYVSSSISQIAKSVTSAAISKTIQFAKSKK